MKVQRIVKLGLACGSAAMLLSAAAGAAYAEHSLLVGKSAASLTTPNPAKVEAPQAESAVEVENKLELPAAPDVARNEFGEPREAEREAEKAARAKAEREAAEAAEKEAKAKPAAEAENEAENEVENEVEAANQMEGAGEVEHDVSRVATQPPAETRSTSEGGLSTSSGSSESEHSGSGDSGQGSDSGSGDSGTDHSGTDGN